MVTFLPVAKKAGAWVWSYPSLCGVPIVQRYLWATSCVTVLQLLAHGDRCSMPAVRSIWSMYHTASFLGLEVLSSYGCPNSNDFPPMVLSLLCFYLCDSLTMLLSLPPPLAAPLLPTAQSFCCVFISSL